MLRRYSVHLKQGSQLKLNEEITMMKKKQKKGRAVKRECQKLAMQVGQNVDIEKVQSFRESGSSSHQNIVFLIENSCSARTTATFLF